MDKTSCLVMAGLMAVMTGVTLWQGNENAKYYEALRRWCEANPEKAAKDPDCAQWVAQVTSETDVAPVPSGINMAPIDTGTTAAKPEDDPEKPPVPDRPDAGHPTDDQIKFNTAEHEIVLSTRGASLQYLTLRNVLGSVYRPIQTSDEDALEPVPFQPLHPYFKGDFTAPQSFALLPNDEAFKDVATANWIHEELPDGSHRFQIQLENGILLTKTYSPPQLPPAPKDPDDDTKGPRLFHFDLKVEIRNTASAAQRFGYDLYGAAGMVEQEIGRSSYGQEYVLATLSKDGKEIELDMDPVLGFDQIDKSAPDETTNPVEGTVHYYGTGTKYFAAVVIPQEGTRIHKASSMGLMQYHLERQPNEAEQEGDHGFDPIGVQSLPRGHVQDFNLAPGEAVTHEYMIYVGPRQETSIFEQPSYESQRLDDLVYFGWGLFDSFARVLVWVLSGLNSVFGNWGVSILVLTVMVRLMMLPLSMWSQKNMLRMQTLAPEINKLKEKYSKEDGSMTPEQQKQFQAAQMELWRKHNVNPVGCIGPIFLQMPIFIGLYNALNYSVAMRHSEFAFWIGDLSVPDIAARMPESWAIPLIDTNAISILPLLMVCTYVLQQKIQPKPADEKAAEQQKIMKFVMPLFGFLFYTMPSGLLLYFITSSLWSIAEQLTIKKKIKADEEARQGGAEKPKDKDGLPKPGGDVPVADGGPQPDKGKKKRKNKKKGK